MNVSDNEEKNSTDWFKNHSNTLSIIGVIVGALIWINSQFGAIRNDLALLDKDIAIIKTVMVMKNIIPNE